MSTPRNQKVDLEHLIRKTDALTYLNALKAGMSELKEELSTIEETREYQAQAIERARKIMRRLDNQYRAIVKSANAAADPPKAVHIEEDWSVLTNEEIANDKSNG
jgi:hypothetical protein